MLRWFKRRAAGTPEVGRRGERVASKRLRRDGYRVLRRNVRTPVGEADLVCTTPDGRTLVIVEVKTRILNPSAPAPEANITERKRAKLRTLTELIAKQVGMERAPHRIDVVAVELDPETHAVAAVRHHISAVGG